MSRTAGWAWRADAWGASYDVFARHHARLDAAPLAMAAATALPQSPIDALWLGSMAYARPSLDGAFARVDRCCARALVAPTLRAPEIGQGRAVALQAPLYLAVQLASLVGLIIKGTWLVAAAAAQAATWAWRGGDLTAVAAGIVLLSGRAQRAADPSREGNAVPAPSPPLFAAALAALYALPADECSARDTDAGSSVWQTLLVAALAQLRDASWCAVWPDGPSSLPPDVMATIVAFLREAERLGGAQPDVLSAAPVVSDLLRYALRHLPISDWLQRLGRSVDAAPPVGGDSLRAANVPCLPPLHIDTKGLPRELAQVVRALAEQLHALVGRLPVTGCVDRAMQSGLDTLPIDQWLSRIDAEPLRQLLEALDPRVTAYVDQWVALLRTHVTEADVIRLVAMAQNGVSALTARPAEATSDGPDGGARFVDAAQHVLTVLASPELTRLWAWLSAVPDYAPSLPGHSASRATPVGLGAPHHQAVADLFRRVHAAGDQPQLMETIAGAHGRLQDVAQEYARAQAMLREVADGLVAAVVQAIEPLLKGLARRWEAPPPVTPGGTGSESDDRPLPATASTATPHCAAPLSAPAATAAPIAGSANAPFAAAHKVTGAASVANRYALSERSLRQTMRTLLVGSTPAAQQHLTIVDELYRALDASRQRPLPPSWQPATSGTKLQVRRAMQASLRLSATGQFPHHLFLRRVAGPPPPPVRFFVSAGLPPVPLFRYRNLWTAFGHALNHERCLWPAHMEMLSFFEALSYRLETGDRASGPAEQRLFHQSVAFQKCAGPAFCHYGQTPAAKHLLVDAMRAGAIASLEWQHRSRQKTLPWWELCHLIDMQKQESGKLRHHYDDAKQSSVLFFLMLPLSRTPFAQAAQELENRYPFFRAIGIVLDAPDEFRSTEEGRFVYAQHPHDVLAHLPAAVDAALAGIRRTCPLPA